MAHKKDHKEPEQGKINYGFGELNPVQEADVFDAYDQTTNGVDTLKNVSAKNFEPNTLASPGGFKAICLRVDLSTQGNAAGSWIADIFGGGEPELRRRDRLPARGDHRAELPVPPGPPGRHPRQHGRRAGRGAR